MPKKNIDELWAEEAAICTQCPLRYCVLERYAEGTECLYLYTADPKHRTRLKLIEKYLDEPRLVTELSKLTKIHIHVLRKLCNSDILIADIDRSVSRWTIVKAVNWPAEVMT